MSYKKAFALLLGCFWMNVSGILAQDQKIADSLAQIYQQNILTDTAKLKLLGNLSFNEITDLKKGLGYAEELIKLAGQAGNKKYLRIGYFLKGNKKRALGKLDEALEAYFKSAALARETNHLKGEGDTYGAIADTYSLSNNHANAMLYYHMAIHTLRSSKDSISLASTLLNAGDEFRRIKTYDSALIYFQESKVIFDKVGYLSGKAYCLGNIGMVYANVGKNYLAEKNINEAIRILEQAEDYSPICEYLISMADVYSNKGDVPTAMMYTSRSLHLAEQYGLKEQIRDAHLKMSELHERTGNANEALRHYKTYITYRDSINNLGAERNMSNLRYNYAMAQKQIEIKALDEENRNKQKLAVLLGIILGLSIIILAILYRNNQHKKKAYKTLIRQKQETDRQKAKAEEALIELQVTQKQLIQSAKMASLGELTTGIAHEIQNPLNFVNNFSEVSVELLGELQEGPVTKLTAADKTEADQIILALANNLRKIWHHGKQAGSIVKSMLQHSRKSTGIKEPTDINALADEYLRLSYHGVKANEKDFTARIVKDFDESIGKIDVVPQDIGRVLLNLYNNAFYAVKEKKNREKNDFEPLVSVSTKKAGKSVILTVKDNGAGIPRNILDKIFQPFFTTKPTGQGTGLGLSLSYEIIKAHGGELKVETREGEYTEFIVLLPVGTGNETFD
ncbi:MAG TPA: ATP-binding protein [Flavisolibacter sp.]|nr:ATP-binding protein [Flavisolibacter sp.]